MLAALQTLLDNGLSKEALDSVIIDLLTEGNIDSIDNKRCLVALAWSRQEGNDTEPDNVGVASYRDWLVAIGDDEYLVLTDEEKEKAWESALEKYGKECVEGYIGPYFDRERWKLDARKDGAAQYLSDFGSEHDYCCGRNSGNEWWHIFRVD